jgi:hypothetical protein
MAAEPALSRRRRERNCIILRAMRDLPEGTDDELVAAVKQRGYRTTAAEIEALRGWLRQWAAEFGVPEPIAACLDFCAHA